MGTIRIQCFVVWLRNAFLEVEVKERDTWREEGEEKGKDKREICGRVVHGVQKDS